ncbi:GNAT family N-acetyltransferase [Microvirga flavescens]|uniref:GNAT family N-acetyltransferase n=1 Tax=Microvirga flavescens TaxID=2249811 RepID=UPI000DD92A7B|nr:GNAT family N-acetyltransferase [Microvirga flavescens]
MSLPQEPLLSFENPDESAKLHETIQQGLRAFNRALFPAHRNGQDMTIAIRDAATGDAVGGLLGRTSGGWLGIELLFVPESLRGGGLASRLIGMAEEEARRRGCHSAWLDSLNAKAVALYEKLGYSRFGELQDYPLGNSRVFLQKKL